MVFLLNCFIIIQYHYIYYYNFLLLLSFSVTGEVKESLKILYLKKAKLKTKNHSSLTRKNKLSNKQKLCRQPNGCERNCGRTSRSRLNNLAHASRRGDRCSYKLPIRTVWGTQIMPYNFIKSNCNYVYIKKRNAKLFFHLCVRQYFFQ